MGCSWGGCGRQEETGTVNAQLIVREPLPRSNSWPCIWSGSETMKDIEPWSLTPDEFGTWFEDNIRYDLRTFDKDCREATDIVVQHIYHNFKVAKIIKGGSLGKDTMLADYSDVDLVAFVNPPTLEPILDYESPEDYRNKLKTVIWDWEQSLSKLPSVTIKRSDDYLINFDIKVGGRSVKVDLLPTADNDHPDVYSEMMTQKRRHREFYSAGFVEKQRDFVRDQSDEVKDLIRMVKYWAYTCLPNHLQKSYPLELITIFCWAEADEPEKFDIADGLKTVFEWLSSKRWKRRTFWQEHYSKDTALHTIKSLRMKFPVMLDPANPTNNVLKNFPQGEENMKTIQKVASMTLKTPLLRDAYSLIYDDDNYYHY